MFMHIDHGIYNIDDRKIGLAHKWNICIKFVLLETRVCYVYPCKYNWKVSRRTFQICLNQYTSRVLMLKTYLSLPSTQSIQFWFCKVLLVQHVHKFYYSILPCFLTSLQPARCILFSPSRCPVVQPSTILLHVGTVETMYIGCLS